MGYLENKGYSGFKALGWGILRFRGISGLGFRGFGSDRTPKPTFSHRAPSITTPTPPPPPSPKINLRVQGSGFRAYIARRVWDI